MSDHQASTALHTENIMDLEKLKILLERLDLCTKLRENPSDATEIHSILSAVKDHLENPAIRYRLLSDQYIAEIGLPNIFIRFCNILIAFSASLPDYSIFSTILAELWEMVSKKIAVSLERGSVSITECYQMAISGLSTDESFAYLGGENDKTVFVTCIKIFLLLLRAVVWSDSRRMENMRFSEYTTHKCLYEIQHDQTIQKIITFIDHFFTNTTIHGARIECIQLTFVALVAVSDSKNMLPMMVRLGFPSKLVEWLDSICQRNSATDPLKLLIITIANVSQCEEGIIALNNANAIETLRKSETVLSETLKRSPFTYSFYPRIYANVATINEVDTPALLKPAIDFVLQKIHEANTFANLRSTTGHLYEYLVSLAKMLVNDNIAKYILDSCELGGLSLFMRSFLEHNVVEPNDLFVKHLIRLALYNIMCSLAFRPTVQSKLNENEVFLAAVTQASNESTANTEAFIPLSLRNNLMTVKAAADGILVYLDKFKAPTLNVDQVAKVSQLKSPMISYSHRDVTFCRSVVAALKQHLISVWIDEDGHCLSDDCWEEIAIAIPNASMVLMVISENYCTKSDSCRVQATYATKLKIPIIALYIDENYQAEPWLDIHLTGLRVRFGNQPFDEAITRLAKYISAL
ncbi:hypothetical protein I4U23_016675 [Adineta vaga]|nr:hypothetical protein I4U23_016675 [Adineta vaga]